MAGTAMPRSHRGTGVSPVNDWDRSLCLASHLIPPSQATTSVVPTAPEEREELSQGRALVADARDPCLRDQRAPAGARGGPTTPAGERLGAPMPSGGSLG